MMPLLPPDDSYDLDDIEKEPGFVTYAWWPPLCPWCAQWLRPVDMRPIGIPFKAITACPAYHGLFAAHLKRWVDLRPPNITRGSDGAWWTSLTTEQLLNMSKDS